VNGDSTSIGSFRIRGYSVVHNIGELEPDPIGIDEFVTDDVVLVDNIAAEVFPQYVE
jgi:hypothetical protein